MHDTTLDQIHFHEVGAVDSIVDIVGTVLGLHLLGVDKVYASPLPMGTGFIKCMHGLIPSPAPATLEVLRDVPIYGTGVEGELVTPTGAALITSLADGFINLPGLTVDKVGYGSGKKVIAEHPNLLRLIVGDRYETKITGPVSGPGSADHKHTHKHDHGHDHGDGHKHSHDHGHSHAQGHSHDHGQSDKLEQGHDHSHNKEHDHAENA